MGLLGRFWERYSYIDPSHAAHAKAPDDRARTIPVLLHGDEGRGLAKVPVLVESLQPLISWMGGDVLNSLGRLGTAR